MPVREPGSPAQVPGSPAQVPGMPNPGMPSSGLPDPGLPDRNQQPDPPVRSGLRRSRPPLQRSVLGLLNATKGGAVAGSTA